MGDKVTAMTVVDANSSKGFVSCPLLFLFICLMVVYSAGCAAVKVDEAVFLLKALKDDLAVRPAIICGEEYRTVEHCIRRLYEIAPNLPKEVINELKRIRPYIRAVLIDDAFTDYLAILAKCGDRAALKELAFISIASDEQLAIVYEGMPATLHKELQDRLRKAVGAKGMEALKDLRPMYVAAVDVLCEIVPEQAVGVLVVAAFFDDERASNALQHLSSYFGEDFESTWDLAEKKGMLLPYMRKCDLLPFPASALEKLFK